MEIGTHCWLELLVLRRLIHIWYPHVLVDFVKHVHCKCMALVQLESIHNLPHSKCFLRQQSRSHQDRMIDLAVQR